MSGEYHLEELATGVYARLGSGPIQPNCGFIVGDEDVTLFDTTYSPAAARAIAADVARVTTLPIATVVISHHHWDHAWGTQVFPSARVIGHANTRTALIQRAEASVETLRKRADAAAGWMCVPGEQFAAELEELRVTPPTLTFAQCLAALCAEVAAAKANGAADAAAALEQVRLADFADWAGRDFLPGSVRRIWDTL